MDPKFSDKCPYKNTQRRDTEIMRRKRQIRVMLPQAMGYLEILEAGSTRENFPLETSERKQATDALISEFMHLEE